MNITVTKAAIPPCCANCWFNDWQEDGPHCVHPAHWEDDQFELDEDGTVFYCGDPETNGGDVDWDDVCEHHHLGVHPQLPEVVIEALIDQRHAEAAAVLKAQTPASS
jgi:hypothetical protein